MWKKHSIGTENRINSRTCQCYWDAKMNDHHRQKYFFAFHPFCPCETIERAIYVFYSIIKFTRKNISTIDQQ